MKNTVHVIYTLASQPREKRTLAGRASVANSTTAPQLKKILEGWPEPRCPLYRLALVTENDDWVRLPITLRFQ